MSPLQKLILKIVLACIVISSAVAIGSFAFQKLSQPNSTQTRIETDVRTKDIIIKSEKDLSTASNELDSIELGESEDKDLDQLMNGF